MIARATALAVLALALLAPGVPAAPHLSPVGTFSSPVYVTAPPADPHRVFVVERAGRVMEVLDGTKLATPFLDISALVRSGGEQGLLSMAFAPDYATSGRFYVYYTAPRAGDANGSVITVDEFRRAAGTSDAADPATRRNVYVVDHPTNTNHNGGQLQFGPDGLLYAGTGDGGGGNDGPNNAQRLDTRLGKLLRVDPLSADAARPEIYTYGLRNPFRFSFDRQTGDLIIADVGQSAREEVDFSPRGTAAGTNYGWHCWEGTIQTPGVSPACNPPNDVFPVLEKNHSGDGYCAIIGGYVVRDASLGSLAGRYVYGDICATHIRSTTLPTTGGDADTGLDVPGISSFGEDSCGHVYVTSLDGPLYRLDGDTFTPCPEEPATQPPGGGGGGGGTPPGGGPGPGGGPPPVTDTRAPGVRIGAQRRQRALRVRGFRLAMTCDELCGATATGSVRIAQSKHVYRLAPMTRQLAAGARVKVRLRASSRALKAMRAALRRHRRVTATLTLTGRDAAGNAGVAERRVRARR
jgi:hypothetical protein